MKKREIQVPEHFVLALKGKYNLKLWREIDVRGQKLSENILS